MGLKGIARWDEELDQLSERIGAHVRRIEPRTRVTAYIRAVVGGGAVGVERRNG